MSHRLTGRGAAGSLAAVTATPPVDRETGGAGSARTETQSIESDVAPDAVVALLADPRRLPEWAPAFADTVAGDAQSGWRAIKDGRPFELRVATSTDARTVDYLREVAPGREGGAYLRAVPRPGGGSVIVMTLHVPSGSDLAVVAATLRDELGALAELVIAASG